jgi:predicted GTPase
VSKNIKSETSLVKGLVTTWLGEQDQDKLIVIDTPGIGDSEGRDTEHIA